MAQELIWNKLQKLIESQRLPHGLALAGGSLEERRDLAHQLALVLVGEKSFAHGVLQVEPDGTQIKIEQSRQILSFLSLTSISAARVVIVEEAQLFNPQAANALLKMVEEPPKNTFFLMLTPSITLLLPTLRSRLQLFRLAFTRVELVEAEEELKSTVSHAFQGLLSRDRAAWNDLVDCVKDREVALQASRLLQRNLRASILQEKSASPTMLRLWSRAFQMEQDILGHLDRTLLFENYYYQAQV